jgi:hypothetical protein
MGKPDSKNPDNPRQTDAGSPIRVGPDGEVHSLLSQIERQNLLSTDGLSKADETKIPGNTALDHPTGQTFTQCLELGELILRSLDGNITSEDFAQLEKWIAEHPDALRYYLDYVHLCVDLQISSK